MKCVAFWGSTQEGDSQLGSRDRELGARRGGGGEDAIVNQYEQCGGHGTSLGLFALGSVCTRLELEVDLKSEDG